MMVGASARAQFRSPFGYAGILGQSQGDLFAHILPLVMLGSLTAIIFAGTLNYVGKKYVHLPG